jgi:hypothetical protein
MPGWRRSRGTREDPSAMLVGVAGAVAWEIVAGLLIFVGIPFFSIVETLGAGAAERERVGISWSVSMLLHLIVGLTLDGFYAYFF